MNQVDLQLQLLWLTRPLVLWVHTSAASTGSWQWQQARKNGQGQKISQLWSTPRQNNTCLDISYTSRTIQLSSVLHVHSFTLSKHSLTLLTHRGYTPLKHILLSTSIVNWGFVLDWKCHHLLLWIGAALWHFLIKGDCPRGCRISYPVSIHSLWCEWEYLLQAARAASPEPWALAAGADPGMAPQGGHGVGTDPLLKLNPLWPTCKSWPFIHSFWTSKRYSTF